MPRRCIKTTPVVSWTKRPASHETGEVSACGSHDVLSGLYIAEQNRLKSGDAKMLV